MEDVELWKWVVGTGVTVLLGYLTYRGGAYTADRAKEGATQSVTVDAQESALNAWQELLQPYREEVAALRVRQDEVEKKHSNERREMQGQIKQLSERVDLLTIQVRHWKRLARVMARWATTLRDQVLSLGGEIPATPEELLLIQSLDDDEL